jgi:hypothetical protein
MLQRRHLRGTSEPGEPGGPREPVVIESRWGCICCLNDAIKVEDYEASYMEAL